MALNAALVQIMTNEALCESMLRLREERDGVKAERDKLIDRLVDLEKQIEELKSPRKASSARKSSSPRKSSARK